MVSQRRWERPPRRPWSSNPLSWLIPGLALTAGPRSWTGLLWILTSAAMTAVLLWLGLTARVWPVAVLLLLPAWYLAALSGARTAAGPSSVLPGTWLTVTLALVHWLPALAVLVIAGGGWTLLEANNPASLPVLSSGEVAACRAGSEDEGLSRGALVVAGAEGARFLGRVLGLPGEELSRTRDGWTVDQRTSVASERELLLPRAGEEGPETRSLVYRIGDSYLSLWSRGSTERTVEPRGAMTLASDEVYVLALDHRSGAALDSRALGGLPLDEVQAARCFLLWSSARPARLGRPVP